MSRDVTETPRVESRARTANEAWKRSAPTAALALVAVLLIFWPTTVFTARFWETNGAYSHGYLIVPIALYLVWLSRRTLAARTPRIRLWGLPLLLATGILWGLAYVVEVQLVMQLALFAALGVMLWTLLGTDVCRRLAFPYAYLLLAIPIWSVLIPYLQEYTAIASTKVLQSFGVPVYLEAFYINIPSGQFIVEDVCAGLRYFLATLSIAALYAYLNFRRMFLGVVFVLFAIAMSVIMNWARVTVIILVGHLSHMQSFLVRDHIAFGWLMFVVALIPIFVFGVWLQRFDARSDASGRAPRDHASRPAAPAGRITATTLVALLAVAVGPAIAYWAPSKSAPPGEAHLSVPVPASPWTAAPSADADWGPAFVGASAEVRASYSRGDAEASLYMAFYASEHEGAELINEVNRFYDDGLWKPRAHNRRRVALAGESAMDVREIQLVAGNGDERLVWYWYRVGGEQTANPNIAKLWQLWSGLTGPVQGAVIAVSTRGGESVEATRARLEAFVEAIAAPAAASVEKARAP